MNEIRNEEEKLANLYIGDCQDCEEQQLKENDIKTVVNVSAYQPETAVMMNWRYLQIPLHDNDNVEQPAFDYATNIVEDVVGRAWRWEEPALVHCGAGQSRSAAVLAAAVAQYLRKTHLQGYTFEDGLQLVQEARPSANPQPALRKRGERYLEDACKR